MIYSITASKDTTLYETEPTQNTGLDQILEISKNKHETILNTFENTRALIQFDLTAISRSCANGTITNPSFYLKVFETEAQNIPLSYTVYAHPVSESWDNGYGYFVDYPITTVGASWTYKNYYPSGTNWAESGSSYLTASVSQDYEYESSDIFMDVTDIVNSWLSGSYSNYGFVLKRSDVDESSSAWLGQLKFYSKETHTIYEPRLAVYWDDSSWVTRSAYYTSHSLAYRESTYIPSGTLADSPDYDFISGSTVYQYYPAITELTAKDIEVYTKKLKSKYDRNSIVRFDVEGRQNYVQKTFNRSFHSASLQYLPTSSYYSVIDAHTGETVLPFDNTATKISLDTYGNYYTLWMDQFPSNRYYKFEYKIVRSGRTEFFDGNFIFKVE